MWSEGLESWWMGVSWKVRPRGNLTMRSSRRAISIHVVVVGHSARLIAGVMPLHEVASFQNPRELYGYFR